MFFSSSMCTLFAKSEFGIIFKARLRPEFNPLKKKKNLKILNFFSSVSILRNILAYRSERSKQFLWLAVVQCDGAFECSHLY